MAIQKATYTILKKDKQFEIRKYDSMVLASTNETTLSGSTGFSRVFNYISGYNESNQKIAMTAPVFNRIDQQMTTAFVMPSNFDLSSLPKPKDKQLQLINMPETIMIACSFKGNVNQKIIQEVSQQTLGWAKKQNLKVVGPLILARYQPPFLPWFLKKSDILFEIEATQLV